MRKLALLMHTSLDGYVATETGGMDWICLDDEMFDDVGDFTDESDAALYGRVTYEMMEGYWPNAGNQPNASAHDKKHSDWYNAVTKYVVSHSNPKTGSKAEVIGKNLAEEIRQIKSKPGKKILMIGSPSTAQALLQEGLVDEFLLNVNPVMLGKGITMYPQLKDRANLELVRSKTYKCGVVSLIYVLKK